MIAVRVLLCVVLASLLASCAATDTSRQNSYTNAARNTVAKFTLNDIEQFRQAGSARAVLPDEDVLRIFNWLASGDYQRASQWLNRALNYQIDSPSLQFLNGLTYHLMSTRDVSKRPLAREGYRLAIRFDRNHRGAHRFLGMLEMESRNYAQALDYLSQATSLNTEPGLLEDMGSAAYLAHQPDIAAGIFNQLLESDPDNQQYRSTYALTLAALGLNQQAVAVANGITTAPRHRYTLNRIDDWHAYYQRNLAAPVDSELSSNNQVANNAGSPAQFFQESEPDFRESEPDFRESEPDPEENHNLQDNGQSDDGGHYKSNQMVILDVVIIRSEEEALSSAGVNLLNGLNILFDRSKEGPGSDWQTTGLRLATDKKILGGGISGGALQYSLNIVNTTSNQNEVLARPSLVAVDGEASNFFSGVNINAAAVSSGADFDDGGDSIVIEKDVGVTLSVKPTFLKDGQIELEIRAGHTFITEPNEAVTFNLRIDTLKTEINGHVVMDIGDTLILSGLNEKTTRIGRSGVPLLQDIPGVQYLFSRRTTLDFQRSVLILVTPRLPVYTYRGAGADEANDSGEVHGGMELQMRHADWFAPYPNWASIFRDLKYGRLYNEFHNEDVTQDFWQNSGTMKARLRDAVKFLYY